MAFSNKIITSPQTGQQIRFLKTTRDTSGQMLEMESTYLTHSTEPVAHYHPYQDEYFTVISGELTVKLKGQVHMLRSGDTLHIPPNLVHSMWNASEAETVVNWQVKPALETEYLLETTFGLASDGKSDSTGKPSILQAALLMRHFADVFRLAKPPKAVQQVVFGLLSPIAYLLGYRATYKKYLD
ncbi:hypothetical protein GCM10028805_04720 [Spirosoma harenae]